MNPFAPIFTDLAGKVVDSLGELFTSDEDRLAARNKLQIILNDGAQQVRDSALERERQLTNRLALDMRHGSFLSRNIRPASLIFVGLVVSLLAVTDGNLVWGTWDFQVKDSYVELFHNLLLVMVTFYFGSRGMESVAKMKQVASVQRETVRRVADKPALKVDLFGPEE